MGALNAFAWFLLQAVTVGGLGVGYFALAFALLAGLFLFLLKRQPAGTRRRLAPMLTALPAVWIFVGLWGGFFWAPLGSRQATPPWVGYPLEAAFWFFLLQVAYFTWRLKGARLLVAVYAAINAYFLVAMVFLAGMAIGGSWL